MSCVAFVIAAAILAITPGPGIAYVVALRLQAVAQKAWPRASAPQSAECSMFSQRRLACRW
jgi:threonine/homoserine/homoserine lactone efflux protein